MIICFRHKWEYFFDDLDFQGLRRCEKCGKWEENYSDGIGDDYWKRPLSYSHKQLEAMRNYNILRMVD